MSSFLETLRPLVDRYGYWAVSGAVLIEDFGMPVPGEMLLISGALLASRGELHLAPLLLTAWAGAVVGDNIGYAIGRWGGRALLLRYGRYLLITQRRLERAEGFFQRHGGAVVAVAHFIDVLRQINGIIAGAVEMPWRRFLFFNALGAALWVGFWGNLFYLVGERADELRAAFERFESLLLGALAARAVGWFAWLLLRPRRPR